MKQILERFLVHPKVTVAALAAALTSLAGSCAAFVAALAPLLHLDFLKPWYPLLMRIDGDLVGAGALLMAGAGILTALCAAGRSFIQSIDQGAK